MQVFLSIFLFFLVVHLIYCNLKLYLYTHGLVTSACMSCNCFWMLHISSTIVWSRLKWKCLVWNNFTTRYIILVFWSNYAFHFVIRRQITIRIIPFNVAMNSFIRFLIPNNKKRWPRSVLAVLSETNLRIDPKIFLISHFRSKLLKVLLK